MPLESISDAALRDNIRRYREAGKEVGGPFSLAQLLVEERRRKRSPFPVVELARKILELSRSSSDGQTTYLELWHAFRPGVEWKGHGSQTAVGNALAQVVAYCVRHKLPIITVLVVQSASRRLGRKAVLNIYEECRALGIDVGPNPDAFVRNERAKALAMPSNALSIEELA